MSEADLIARVVDGDQTARGDLVTEFDRSGPDTRTTMLDELAAQGAAGSSPATEVLLELVHRHRVAHPAITSLLIDPADIADAAQLTLIAVMERIAQFEGRSRFQTWVRSVARNEALQLLRRKQRKSEPVSDAVPERAAFTRRLSSVVADEMAVQQAIARIPEPFREALVLREFDQLGYDEIAARLDVPIGTVRSRIARAREHLAQQTWHWG